MNRFYLVYKPKGLSSFFTLKVLKKKLDFPKFGHAGTLDPLAQGLLLVAMGNYTKLLPYLENTSKEYIFEMELGATSASYDEGTDISRIDEQSYEKYRTEITLAGIKSIIEKNFTGEISQVPPVYSAVKVDGVAAVKRTRGGQKLNLKAKKIYIYDIEILDFSFPRLKLRANVSSGTYVRSIAHDLGQILGCGAVVTYLERTKIGKLTEKFATGVDDFDAEKILSPLLLFPSTEYLELPQGEIEKINLGLPVRTQLTLNPEEKYFITSHGQISHIVFFRDGYIHPLRKI